MLRPSRSASLSMVLFSCAWVFSGTGYAQTGQGILTGSVTDSSGAIVTGVSVIVRNQNTGFVYNAVTTQDGIYRVPYLNVGSYEVTYEAPGFKKLARKDIPIRSTETLRLDVALEVGNVVESVEVSAGAQLLSHFLTWSLQAFPNSPARSPPAVASGGWPPQGARSTPFRPITSIAPWGRTRTTFSFRPIASRKPRRCWA